RERLRLAVLVPAHDEEATLPGLLASLRSGTRRLAPEDIHVVADNCSDSTAAVARALGAIAHERHDRDRIGKGHALQWLLTRMAADGLEYDGYVFLDAD